MVRVRFCSLSPKFTGFSKPVLLVLVIKIRRVILDCSIIKKSLWKTIPVFIVVSPALLVTHSSSYTHLSVVTSGPKTSLLFSSRAASIISGAAPKNFIPSDPAFAFSLTHCLACSVVEISYFDPCPNPVYWMILGAIISFFSLFLFKSRVQSLPLPLALLQL